MKYTVIKRENKTSGWKSKTYYVRYYENGKLKYVDTKKTNKKDANIFAEDLIGKIPSPIKINNSALRTLTLKQYLEKFNWFSKTEMPPFVEYKTGLSTHNFQERAAFNTASSLNRIINELEDEIGNCLYYNITREDTNAFKKRLSKYKLTNNARNSIINSFRTVYSYLLRTDNYLNTNPFSEAKTSHFPVVAKKKYVLKPYEIYFLFDKNLLEKIEPVYISKEKWLKFLDSDFFLEFKFTAYTGLRANESMALIRSQIKDKRIVSVNRAFKDNYGKVIGLPKDGKTRTIILCDEAYKCIADKLEIRKNDEYIFQTSIKTHLYNRFKYYWVVYRNEILAAFDINIENCKFTRHGLRKSLNSNLINYSSLNLKESWIRAYCGWSEGNSSLSVIQEQHYTDLEVQKTLNKVAKEIQRMYVKEPNKLFNNFTNGSIKTTKKSKGYEPAGEENEKINFLQTVCNLMGEDIENNIREIQITNTENIEDYEEAKSKLEIIRQKENELVFIQLLIKIKSYINNQLATKELTSEEADNLLNFIVELLNRKDSLNINKLAFKEHEIMYILEHKIVKELISYFDDVYELAFKVSDSM